MIRAIICLILLSSCSKFVEMSDDQFYEEIDSQGNEHINLLFSHNINGETHPCGCRQFPLGGLPQANGVIKSLKKEAPTLYVDTGDTFFETTIVPQFIKSSSEYKAKKIAQALDLLELKFMTPGDQDFSLGEEFLVEISKKHKFKFLISNSSKLMKIQHQKLARVDTGNLALFFIGVLSPELLRAEYRDLLVSPLQAIKAQINTIQTKYKHLKNKKIILLSHSGMELDEKIALSFPNIDWIIGAHSQSFLSQTNDVGSTKIVQTLSRNHYIGHISLALNKKAKSKYKLIQTLDNTQHLIKENSMIKWLSDYKTQLDKIYLLEQKSSLPIQTETQIPTYISCSDCHTQQVDFWQGSAHSTAFASLIHAKSSNNPNCVKCHSVGYNQEGGFFSTKKIVTSSNPHFNIDHYWKEFSKDVPIKHPIRKQTAHSIRKSAKAWIKKDVKEQLTNNYANVQCLNCHQQTAQHPFSDTKSQLPHSYKDQCISCHTRDQSPNWYDKDTKGLATSLNQKYFSKKLKQVSCPKIEKE